ncbi:UNVERIFIED_CONTAM: Non-specific lipid-transfer protein 2 [Sesamum angustifolium]|uniref:Non-specific lipid-transfer protein n=1 Tax=Sesamum angustifolium TaxID=2727405 RepID=A0AAW2P1D9_9LAMI
MAGVNKSMCIVLIAAALVVAVAPRSEAAIGCNTVVSYLNPCLPYITNKGPLGKCCSGVKGLYDAAQTTPDRQSVCNCLESLTGTYANVDLNKAAGVPKQCGVNVPYKISPSTNCTEVK